MEGELSVLWISGPNPDLNINLVKLLTSHIWQQVDVRFFYVENI